MVTRFSDTELNRDDAASSPGYGLRLEAASSQHLTANIKLIE